MIRNVLSIVGVSPQNARSALRSITFSRTSIRIEIPIELRVGLPGDLFSPLVVDVTVGPEDRDVSPALDRDLAGFAHLYFLMSMRVPHSPEVISTSSIRLLMMWRPHPRRLLSSNVFCGVGDSTPSASKPCPRSRTSISRHRPFVPPTRNVMWT